MHSSERYGATGSAVAASTCAFAVIASQVAGKAMRDALFLSQFDISALPLVLIVSASLSITAVLLTARAMSRWGPIRIIPPFYFASALLLFAEWALAVRDPRLASVIVFLHASSISAILISGFWSIINEHFDPRSARQAIGRIVGFSAIGGLFGGVLAERAGAADRLLWLLPLVGILHAVCGVMLFRLRPAGEVKSPAPPAANAPNAREERHESGLSLLLRTSYLRNIALVVLLGNTAATLIDFLFKAQAANRYSDGAELVRFFAVFYTVVSVMTVVVQAGFTRNLLQRAGIANVVAMRPAVVTLGGVAVLPVMGLAGLGILRAVEAVMQSSLFRSAYELLFAPVIPREKRSAKIIADVGADRMGDVLGGAVARIVIFLPAAVASPLLLILAVVISALAFIIARMLRRGYIRTLEASLIDRAGVLQLPQDEPVGMQTMMMESFAGIDLSMSLDKIDVAQLRDSSARAAMGAQATPAAALEKAPTLEMPVSDPEIQSLIALRSGDIRRVRAELRRNEALSPVLTAQVISLLAWNEVTAWATSALAKSASTVTGQLVDRLLDPDEDFAIRRRIPRVLSITATQRACDGLMAALADNRFEVRFQSARALSRIKQGLPALKIDAAAVYAAVTRETQAASSGEDPNLLDPPSGGDENPLLDEALRERTSLRMEHAFTLLSLVVPRAPLQIAYKGLLTSDAVLRGTGLEYLESVLPPDIWNRLQPLLDSGAARPAVTRPPQEVLETLMNSSQSIELNLEEIRRRTDSQ
jgi:ATP:ADP antiporter, AAA family